MILYVFNIISLDFNETVILSIEHNFKKKIEHIPTHLKTKQNVGINFSLLSPNSTIELHYKKS